MLKVQNTNLFFPLPIHSPFLPIPSLLIYFTLPCSVPILYDGTLGRLLHRVVHKIIHLRY